jgi:hypothetical protein
VRQKNKSGKERVAQRADQQRQTHWRTCCLRPAGRGETAVLPLITEPRSTARSAVTADTTRFGASGCWTCFSDSAASREQQHWTTWLVRSPLRIARLLRWRPMATIRLGRGGCRRLVPNDAAAPSGRNSQYNANGDSDEFGDEELHCTELYVGRATNVWRTAKLYSL